MTREQMIDEAVLRYAMYCASLSGVPLAWILDEILFEPEQEADPIRAEFRRIAQEQATSAARP